MQPGLIRRLELAWRHRLVYPLLRLLLRNESIQLPIDLGGIRSVLILRYDRLGDMIVTTPVFRALKDRYPRLRVGVFASELNAPMLRNNPHVDEVYVLFSSWPRLWTEIMRARRDGYDLVLNFIFNRTSSAGLLANLIAPHGIKVGQGSEKYRFYFNALLQLDRTQEHMADTLASVLARVTGIQLSPEEVRFDLEPDVESEQAVAAYLASRDLRPRSGSGPGTPYLVFNVSATDPVRRISWEQAEKLARHLANRRDVRTVVISSPRDAGAMRAAVTRAGGDMLDVFPGEGNAPLMQVAALIHGALAVVTPDTGIIHFASAMGTPVLGFFTKLQGMHEWLPYGVAHTIVTADEGMPTSSIPSTVMTVSVDAFLGRILASSTSGDPQQ